MARITIGLVGPIAVGKSTVVEYLEKRGFVSYSLSDRIREEIRSRGHDTTRQLLTKVGNELRQTLGDEILASRTVDLIGKDNPEKVIIDSIRNPGEVNYLKSNLGTKIIGIIAPQEKRFDFFTHRPTNTEGVSDWSEFKALDDLELVQDGAHKQQVQACLDLADIVIDNNGTIEELDQKVEDFISSLV